MLLDAYCNIRYVIRFIQFILKLWNFSENSSDLVPPSFPKFAVRIGESACCGFLIEGEVEVDASCEFSESAVRTGEGAGAGCRSGTADCRHRHRHRLKGTAGWSRRNSETADLRTPPTLPRTCKIDFHLDGQLVFHLLVLMSPSMSTDLVHQEKLFPPMPN